MKVISSAIPGKPEHAIEVGQVYSQLTKIAMARAEQLRTTDRMVLEKKEAFKASVDALYGVLEQELTNHTKATGKQHNESLETLGIPMVNDFPFTHHSTILEKEEWEEYLNPVVVDQAIARAQYQPNTLVSPLRNDISNFGWRFQELYRGFTGLPNDTQVEWAYQTPFYLKGCAAVITPIDEHHMFAFSAPLASSKVTDLRSSGYDTGKVSTLGWNARGAWAEIPDSPPLWLRLDGTADPDGPLVIIPKGPDPDESVRHLAWMGSRVVSNRWFGGCIKADANGVTFAATLTDATFDWHGPAGGSGSPDEISGYGGYPKDITVNFEGKVGTQNVIRVTWKELTGKDRVTFDHADVVHGGFEWLDVGKVLAAILLVNVVDGNGVKRTVTFKWTITLGNTEVTAVREGGAFDWDKDSCTQLPTNHPFHPVNGRGIFKPDGGHVSAVSAGRVTYLFDHLHSIKSLSEAFAQRAKLDKLVSGTTVLLRPCATAHEMGNAVGRLFLTAQDRMLNGQVQGNGVWDYYTSSFNMDTATKSGNVITYRYPNTVQNVLESDHYDHELVNIVQADGNHKLTGLVWSTDNEFTAYEKIVPIAGQGIQARQAKLSESAMTALKAEADTYLVENRYDAYVGFVAYPVGNILRGLAMRVNRNGDVEVAPLTCTYLNGVYDLKRTDDYTRVFQGSGLTNAPGNYREFLMRDFYVYLDGDQTPRITLKHPLKNRMVILELTFNNSKPVVTRRCAPEPGPQGMTYFETVYPTEFGICFTKPDPVIDVFDHNGNRMVIGKEFVNDNYDLVTAPEIVESDFQMAIKGRPYRVPPGLHFKAIPVGESPSMYLGLKDGFLEAFWYDRRPPNHVDWRNDYVVYKDEREE